MSTPRATAPPLTRASTSRTRYNLKKDSQKGGGNLSTENVFSHGTKQRIKMKKQHFFNGASFFLVHKHREGLVVIVLI